MRCRTLNWAFRAFELDLHGRNFDRRIGTKTFAKNVLVLQHHVPERILQTVRQMLSGASDGVIESLRELLFILVTDLHVPEVDIIAVDERKIALCDHRTETWRSLDTAKEKFHAKLPDFVGAGSPCRLP